ncbi:FMN-linked oxidoreductase [Violaceomyces palustris]|uniref:FMN-linked oxidoreductase n=1 Tax=Violaceomyces palustris TaxID=1673888 RepID=A0ACD0P248_9BASI|nr:FMN-linked oxidoreductase [Violaceomyces palustris]
MTASKEEERLFSPIRVGRMNLEHRVVLAPLTRMRADSKDGTLTLLGEAHAEYYSQRASKGGLQITEATFISARAGGFKDVPGIYTSEQLEAWRRITDAVHAKGGFIYAQLWALGRAAPSEFQVGANTYQRVSASETAFDLAKGGKLARALTVEEIRGYVEDYARAAKQAVEVAGFDGVEIHGANGYLVDQFLQLKTNKRTDEYGGSLKNRIRFPLEILKAVSREIGEDRVGIRISPFSEFQGMKDENPLETTFSPYLGAILEQHPKIAYVHAVETRISGGSTGNDYGDQETLEPLREIIREHVSSRKEQEVEQGGDGSGTKFISAGGYLADSARERANKSGDLIAFGRVFISNPDLPERLRNGWELTPYNRSTFYTRTTEGYTDYPTYPEQAKSVKAKV